MRFRQPLQEQSRICNLLEKMSTGSPAKTPRSRLALDKSHAGPMQQPARYGAVCARCCHPRKWCAAPLPFERSKAPVRRSVLGPSRPFKLYPTAPSDSFPPLSQLLVLYSDILISRSDGRCQGKPPGRLAITNEARSQERQTSASMHSMPRSEVRQLIGHIYEC